MAYEENSQLLDDAWNRAVEIDKADAAEKSGVAALQRYKLAGTDQEKEDALKEALARSKQVPDKIRAQVKLKVTDKGADENIWHHYGKENVTPIGGRNYLIEKDGELLAVENAGDRSGLGELWSDLKDIGPEAKQALYAVGGGIVGSPLSPAGTLAAGAAGAAAGTEGRIIESSMVPGEDFRPGLAGALDAAVEVTTEGALDVAGGAVMKPIAKYIGKGASAAAKKMPWTRAGRAASVSAERAGLEAVEATRAGVPGKEIAVPVPLSPGQHTMKLDDLRRELSYRTVWPDVAIKFDEVQAHSISKGLFKVKEAISAGDLSGKEAVGRLTAAAQAKINLIRQFRAVDGAKMYGDLDDMTRGRKIMSSPSAVAVIDEYFARFGKHGTERLQHIRKRLAEPSTMGEFHKTMQDIGGSIKGGSEFDTLKGVAENKKIAAGLYEAINRDLDKAANDTSSPIIMAADQLKKANRTYRAYSDAIRMEEDSVLHDAILSVSRGKNVEKLERKDMYGQGKLAKKLLTQDESYLREVFAATDKAAPSASAELKRDILAEVIGKSSGNEASMTGELLARSGGNVGPISPRKFANILLGSEEEKGVLAQLRAVLGDGPETKAVDALAKSMRTISGARELSEKLAEERSLLDSMFTNVGGGAAGHSIFGVAGAVIGAGAALPAKAFVRRFTHPRAVAEALLDPPTALMIAGFFDPPKGVSSKWRSRLAGKIVNRVAKYTMDRAKEQEEDAQ